MDITECLKGARVEEIVKNDNETTVYLNADKELLKAVYSDRDLKHIEEKDGTIVHADISVSYSGDSSTVDNAGISLGPVVYDKHIKTASTVDWTDFEISNEQAEILFGTIDERNKFYKVLDIDEEENSQFLVERVMDTDVCLYGELENMVLNYLNGSEEFRKGMDSALRAITACDLGELVSETIKENLPEIEAEELDL